jgi:hypothetical protein
MRQLLTIFIFLTLTKVTSAQIPSGLYFDNVVGTEWLGEEIIDNNGYFNYKDFHLSLIKRSPHLKKDTNNHWIFDTTNVFLISNQDTISQLNYKIDKLNKNIVFKNKGDSISYQYVSVSTGSFVGFSVNRTVEIIGEAQNSKDGAILRSTNIIYRIKNKGKWETSLIGKNIKVIAKITNNETITKTDLGYHTKEYNQGRIGRIITVNLKGKFEVINSKTLSNDILGEWGIYVTIYNGVSANCNVCPRIKFKSDNTARIELPNGEFENYNWQIEENNIVIKPERKNSDNYLSDNTYKMEFKQGKEFTELGLKMEDTLRK